MDDGTDGWKGRPPPDRLRILYKKIYHKNKEISILTIEEKNITRFSIYSTKK
jgi:hypothetical protein